MYDGEVGGLMRGREWAIAMVSGIRSSGKGIVVGILICVSVAQKLIY